MTDNFLPSFIQKGMQNTVIPALESLGSVSISFDLWMSRGWEDIFSLIAHGMDAEFQQKHVHLKLLQCHNTARSNLAAMIPETLVTLGSNPQW